MGVDFNVYVGPYLECTVPANFSTKKERRCPKGCRSDDDAQDLIKKFCVYCGAEFEVRDIQFLSHPKYVIYNLLINERLHILTSYENRVFLAANDSRVGLSLEKGVGNLPPTSYNSSTLQIDEQEFFDVYKLEISHLRKYLGDSGVVVSWGVVSYYA